MKEIIELKSGWRLRELPSTDKLSVEDVSKYSSMFEKASGHFFEAEMPSQVHDILLKAVVIDDPSKLGAPEKTMWVAEKDWLYYLEFTIPRSCHSESPMHPDSAAWSNESAFLNFKGLDTIADIWLNGEFIAHNEDMYLPNRVAVGELLKEHNHLLIHFRSPHDWLSKQTLPEEWEGKILKRRLLRKNDDDFMDYLGPKPYFTRIGIYDKVLLELVDAGEILETDVTINLNNDYTKGFVCVKSIGSADSENAMIEYTIRDSEGCEVECKTSDVKFHGKKWSSQADITINSPSLWWPRGYGDHPVYQLSAVLLIDGVQRDIVTKTLGFRKIEQHGEFNFYINGMQIKLWGAQPAQISGQTHVWDNEKSLRILDLAENCNMNAQRIWGGSDRYDDAYYEETDRRGILVWQEFFHGYAMLPDNDEYRALCCREVTWQIKRLKHHTSIFMWCGGNECIMGAEYTLPGVPYIGKKLFLEDYMRLTAELDPGRYYHPNSPFGGEFMNDPLHGDTHSYTNTWYVPGSDFPIMVAEEIRAAPPALKSVLRYFESPEKAYPKNYDGKLKKNEALPWPETWLERTTTEGWLKIPPIERFYDADDLESLVYKFGAAHAWYLRTILENNRRGKPWYKPYGERINKGHFVCRWNDSWPLIYGSMLDYYLEPFQAYYATKRAYEPVLISFDVQNFIHVWVVNDTPNEIKGTLEISLFDQNANSVVKQLDKRVCVFPGESRIITNLNEFKQFSRQFILFARLMDENGTIITRTNDFVDIERHIRFPNAKLTVTVDGDTLVITTDLFARNIELAGNENGDEFGWVFEDNYFDLLPNEVKRVKISGKHKKGVISAKPYYSSCVSKVTVFI
ncbi:MAG: hypothetical protein LBS84_10995 [Clostridiales bacterium]|nr:hypothetical protein [Clostridiales bacterium]